MADVPEFNNSDAVEAEALDLSTVERRKWRPASRVTSLPCPCFQLAYLLPDARYSPAGDLRNIPPLPTAADERFLTNPSSHLCFDAAILACRNWQHAIIPGAGEDALTVYPAGNGVCLNLAEGWPYPIIRSRADTVMILRQEVSEDPHDAKRGRKTVAQLAQAPLWGRLLAELKLCVTLDADPAEWECDLPFWGWVVSRLATYHLPASIGSARYALWEAAGAIGDPPCWPAHAVQVTSFLFLESLDTETPLLACGGSMFQIHGSASWGSRELLEQAHRAAESHAQWWKAFDIDHTTIRSRRGRGIDIGAFIQNARRQGMTKQAAFAEFTRRHPDHYGPTEDAAGNFGRLWHYHGIRGE